MIWGEGLEVFKIGKGQTRVAYLYHPGELVNLQILNNVGSAHEASEEWGIAHILEHMFFKGSKKRPRPLDISRAANDIGAKLNAYTSYDHTCYHITSLREHFQQAADILIDMFLHPLFPPEEYKKELAPILSELREQEDNPDSYLHERAMRHFFGENYHPIIGTEKTIRDSSSDKMFRFRKKTYGSNHSLISVVGDIQKDELLSALEAFQDYGPTQEEFPPISVEQRSDILTLEKSGISEAYYLYLLPALSADDPKRFQEDLVSYVLGGNDTSLLFERIREELGMSCYGIYAWTMRSKPFHLQGISCGIAPNELNQLHGEVLQQIETLQKKAINGSQLNRAKASIRTSLAARSQTCMGLNGMIAPAILRGETRNPIRVALEELGKINIEDIQQGAQRFFAKPGMQAVLLPKK